MSDSRYRNDPDALGPTLCLNCDAEHPVSYVLTHCAHPDCKVIGCSECLTQCGCCPDAHLCQEHVVMSDLDGTLNDPIPVCACCLAADEVPEAA